MQKRTVIIIGVSALAIGAAALFYLKHKDAIDAAANTPLAGDDNALKVSTDGTPVLVVPANELGYDITKPKPGWVDQYPDVLDVQDEALRQLLIKRNDAANAVPRDSMFMPINDFLNAVLPEYKSVFATMADADKQAVWAYLGGYAITGKGMKRTDDPALFTRLQAIAAYYKLYFIA